MGMPSPANFGCYLVLTKIHTLYIAIETHPYQTEHSIAAEIHPELAERILEPHLQERDTVGP